MLQKEMLLVHMLLIHVCTTQHVWGRAARLCKEQVFTIRSYQQAPVTTSVEIREYARNYLTEILGTVTVRGFVIPAHMIGNFLSRLGSKAELGWAGHVKNDELRFEEDVAVDGEANARVRLDTTEAGCEVSLVPFYNSRARTVGRETYRCQKQGHNLYKSLVRRLCRIQCRG